MLPQNALLTDFELHVEDSELELFVAELVDLHTGKVEAWIRISGLQYKLHFENKRFCLSNFRINRNSGNWQTRVRAYTQKNDVDMYLNVLRHLVTRDEAQIVVSYLAYHPPATLYFRKWALLEETVFAPDLLLCSYCFCTTLLHVACKDSTRTPIPSQTYELCILFDEDDAFDFMEIHGLRHDQYAPNSLEEWKEQALIARNFFCLQFSSATSSCNLVIRYRTEGPHRVTVSARFAERARWI
jgi:hypothetical protein